MYNIFGCCISIILFYLHPYHFQGIPEEELLRQQQELFQQARIKQAQVQYMH